MDEHGKIFPVLAAEWERARHDVLLHALKESGDLGTEATAIERVPHEAQRELLRSLFEASRAVGRAAALKFGRVFLVSEIADFLASSGIACFAGPWHAENHFLTRYLYRGKCSTLPLSICCDYWREAARGLAEGMNGQVEHSRHRSIGHGDPACLDYVFAAPAIDRRRGVVPMFLKVGLTSLIQEMKGQGLMLALEGFNEGTLFFHVEEITAPLHEGTRDFWVARFKCRAQGIFPGLHLADSANQWDTFGNGG